jgi:hypothetical protein
MKPKLEKIQCQSCKAIWAVCDDSFTSFLVLDSCPICVMDD